MFSGNAALMMVVVCLLLWHVLPSLRSPRAAPPQGKARLQHALAKTASSGQLHSSAPRLDSDSMLAPARFSWLRRPTSRAVEKPMPWRMAVVNRVGLVETR